MTFSNSSNLFLIISPHFLLKSSLVVPLPFSFNSVNGSNTDDSNSNTSTLQFYYNGTLASNITSVASATLSYSSGYGLFGQNSGTTGAYATNGQIAEYVGYSYPLGSFQQQQIEGYLAWKWGLQGSLPASHPFKNAPPQ